MKYIRTKDGIYEVTDWNEDGSCWYLNDGGVYFRKENIIAEADTISELCNEFRYKVDGFTANDILANHQRCWRDSNTGKWYDYDTDIALSEKEISTIKGAIWTDKGLIYVAKMNDRGELELI